MDLFDQVALKGLQSKASQEGLDSLSDKEMQVLIAGYFNHKVTSIEGAVRRMGSWVVAGLWTIALGIIANLVVALIAG